MSNKRIMSGIIIINSFLKQRWIILSLLQNSLERQRQQMLRTWNHRDSLNYHLSNFNNNRSNLSSSNNNNTKNLLVALLIAKIPPIVEALKNYILDLANSNTFLRFFPNHRNWPKSSMVLLKLRINSVFAKDSFQLDLIVRTSTISFCQLIR